MGRRKKEAPEVHREHICGAAERLFSQKGIKAATMDDIAKEAGYSKATLYVYFKNKEEITGVLALKSMEKLYAYIESALGQMQGIRGKYDLLCQALLKYQEEFPFYFDMALGEININFNQGEYVPEDKESFRVGEEINQSIKRFLEAGIEAGELRQDLQIMPTIFAFWGMLSGLIRTAVNKEKYIGQELKLSKQEFLAYGFDTLYHSISGKEKDNGR